MKAIDSGDAATSLCKLSSGACGACFLPSKNSSSPTLCSPGTQNTNESDLQKQRVCVSKERHHLFASLSLQLSSQGSLKPDKTCLHLLITSRGILWLPQEGGRVSLTLLQVHSNPAWCYSLIEPPCACPGQDQLSLTHPTWAQAEEEDILSRQLLLGAHQGDTHRESNEGPSRAPWGSRKYMEDGG